MSEILIPAIFVSFFATLFVLPFWIKKAKKIGLIWEDMNKIGHPKKVAGSAFGVLWRLTAFLEAFLGFTVFFF